jgi:hypothetical protein
MRRLIVLMSLISLATVSSPSWAEKGATPVPAPAPVATTGNIFDDITDSVSQTADSFGDALQLSGKELKGLGENTADGASKVEHGTGEVIGESVKAIATVNAGDGAAPRPTARK